MSASAQDETCQAVRCLAQRSKQILRHELAYMRLEENFEYVAQGLGIDPSGQEGQLTQASERDDSLHCGPVGRREDQNGRFRSKRS